MHSYLPAIGFSDIDKEELDEILYEAIRMPDGHEVCTDSEGNEYVEMTLQVDERMGISIRGTYDQNDQFHIDYYYPYFLGETDSTTTYIDIIKQSDKECYQVFCDDMRLGVNLIYFLQNMMEYLRNAEKYSSQQGEIEYTSYLAGLSLDGKILLPVVTNVPVSVQKDKVDRPSLLAAAREGDEDAIESLTLDDMDTYAMISRRIEKEDVYSIVKSTFMPYGIESDKYLILGDILDVKKKRNEITTEDIYIMKVSANDVQFDICINENDLLGEPAIGRRFKGVVWLQGRVEF